MPLHVCRIPSRPPFPFRQPSTITFMHLPLIHRHEFQDQAEPGSQPGMSVLFGQAEGTPAGFIAQVNQLAGRVGGVGHLLGEGLDSGVVNLDGF